MDKDKRIVELEAEIAQLKGEMAKLQAANNWYLEQFRLAQHRRFGSSSEKTVCPEQLGLFNEAEVFMNTQKSVPTIEQTITYTRKKRSGKREELYDAIPTERIVHELPEDERICPDCGGEFHACGHEVLRRELEIIPAQVRAVEHVQTVYACRDCEQNSDADALPMVKSAVPAPVISGSGVASPSLLSFIMCNKWQPLLR